MKVFAVYDPKSSGLIRIWERSWRLNGWEPRLITPREIKKHGSLGEALIKKAGRGRFVLTSLSAINFSQRPGKFRTRSYGKPGWISASVVAFPIEATEDQILNCGRRI